MARIGPGGPFLQPSLTGDEQVAPDDGDGWWAGSQYGFTSIPVAGALAALSLAVSIAGGFNHQDESPYPAQPVHSDAFTSQRAAHITAFKLWEFTDDLPQATVFEEDACLPPQFIRLEAKFTQPWVAEDEFVARIDEEYSWAAPYTVSTRVFAPAFAADEEIVPQPTLTLEEPEWSYTPSLEPKRFVYLPDPEQTPLPPFVVEEDGFAPMAWRAAYQVSAFAADDDFSVAVVVEEDWQVYTPAPEPKRFVYLPDADDIPPAPFVAEEDGFSPLPRLATLQGGVFTADDDLPVAAATLVTDDYWQQPQATAAAIVVSGPLWDDQAPAPGFVDEDPWLAPAIAQPPLRISAFLADEEIVPQPAFVPTDDYWFQLPSADNSLIVVSWPVIGMGAPAVLPAPPEDSPWQVYSPPWASKCFVYLPDPEQYPLLTAASPFASGAATRRTAIRLHLWADTEDLPTPPTPLNIDEEWWNVYVPPLGASPIFGPLCDDQALAASFVDDDPWAAPPAVLLAPKPLYLPDPEQIPAGLVNQPIAVEDDSWLVYTALPPPARFVYLPDPEEIPAGGFTTIEEEDWRVVTPPWPGKQPLYLPDPEEVPAGSLVQQPLVVEDDSWLVYTPPALPARFVYLPDPEELPILFVPTLGIDEEYWRPISINWPVPNAPLFTADDEISVPVVTPPAPVPIEPQFGGGGQGRDYADLDDELIDRLRQDDEECFAMALALFNLIRSS